MACERAAIVTGSATGIGAAIALHLSRLGWGVVLNYTRSVDEVRETERLCREAGGDPVVVQGDVSDDSVCRALAAAAEKHWGRLDGLVSNAGVTKFVAPGDMEGLNKEDFEHIFGVNLIGCWQTARAAAHLMKASGGGSIVTMSSLSAFTGAGSSPAYAASKAALNTLTLSLARALAPDVRVNAVCPGYVDTRWGRRGIGDDGYDAFTTALTQQLPLKRMVVADDIAETVLWFLAGGTAITGQTLVVDSGEHLAGGISITASDET
ncbi:MAG: SDR family NAD(P)-dependent oxidoreductase [Alphaproteobacteria bacterium]|jgi:3-oxoacyl-[acyl-carrier protein] reductase|nr:SDR family oxidoreductase [Rhodospirillaceae bacterium]MBT6512768.1 SDR family oxidoreductase [Rhodospirillaceae bacterium]MBT7612947.1 SDR family oxidoreductase [Rhodospirillaceae bacterium]MBT7647483.1 SDR family oxidoreductase [Rhodospirillaceae bacterium]MDG2479304.1 SDR family NAD(P)-dependent oxidoreductase [Alphaproteobacteria bacterium]